LPSDSQMRNNRKKRLKLLAKVLLFTAYVPVSAEFFLRVFAPVPMLPRYICAAEYGIRANEGNRAYWHRTPEYKVHIRTNSKGIRADKEIPYDKPEGTKRIVVLGDSFGMGYGVNLEDTFTNQVEKYLRLAGENYEVINLSVSGHGNAEELILLRNEGFKYQPDIVIVQWHPTDIDDNIRSQLFGLANDKLTTINTSYLPGVKVREFLFKFAIYRWVAGHSQLFNFVRETVAIQVKKLLVVLKKKAIVSEESERSGESIQDNTDTYAKELTIAILQEIKNECTLRGVDFIIFDVPRRLSRNKFKSFFPMAHTKTKNDFKIFCPIYLFRKQKGKMLYWEKSHGHFTPLGCQIVGKGLAECILEQ